MKQLTILGSTGSIGCSTLDVVRHNPEKFRVAALVAGKNVARMVEQCLEFSPRYAVMDDEKSAALVKAALLEQGSRTEVMSGQQAACDMAALDDVDQVMAAIVGAAGLQPTLAAVEAGLAAGVASDPATCYAQTYKARTRALRNLALAYAAAGVAPPAPPTQSRPAHSRAGFARASRHR